MNEIFELVSDLFFILGVLFFTAGTIGLYRFPDIYCRLHALAKVDNLGLGFIVFALILQASSFFEILKLLLIWLFILITSSSLSYLISNQAYHNGIKPCQKDECFID